MATLPAAGLFSGKVNLVTGPGKACGKTLFAKAAALSARAAGERLALMAVGAEGSCPGKASANDVGLEAGEVFVTAERLLQAASCLPVVLDALPGASALAGPERNEYLALAAERILEEGWASTVIVDGAFNRITQIASLGKARLFYAIAAGKANCGTAAAGLRAFFRLAELPVAAMEAPNGSVSEAYRLAGPLTPSAAERIPKSAGLVVIDDSSKVFLEGRELDAFLRRHRLAVVKGIDFGGFSVALRGIERGAFEDLLGGQVSERVVSWNAYAEDCAAFRAPAAKCGAMS